MPSLRLPIVALVVLFQWLGAGPAVAQEAVISRTMQAGLVLYSDDGRMDFLGSGFLYGDDGIALTNAHVVGDAASVAAVFQDGQTATAQIVALDKSRDIAVLRIVDLQGRLGLQPAPGNPAMGHPVIALGAPLGLGFTATRGMIAAAPRQVEAAVPLRLIQHDAALNPGSSGGPLIDEAGQLVGMNSQIADGSRYFIGISYAIAASDLQRLVPRMLAGTLAPVPQLGIDTRAVTPGIAAALSIAPHGMLIEQTLPDQPAERAGLRAGDVLLAIDATPILQPGDLPFALEAAKGATVNATFLRDGQPKSVTMDLSPSPPAVITPETPLTPAAFTLSTLGITLDADNRVTDLAPDSLAARDGLAPGDVILTLNGGTVDAQVPFATPVLLLVRFDGARTRHILLDPWSTRRQLRPIGNGNVMDPAVERF